MSKTLAFFSAAMLAAPVAARPLPLVGTAALPRPAVVMLWANWCAPCRRELARWPELAAAARPLPLTILALSPTDRARAALGSIATHAFVDPRPPAQVLREWGSAGASLPITVALNRSGTKCGVHRGLIGTDQLRVWARSCSR